MTEAERKGIVDAVIRSGALAALAVDHALTEMADILQSSRDAAIAAEQRAEQAEAALAQALERLDGWLLTRPAGIQWASHPLHDELIVALSSLRSHAPLADALRNVVETSRRLLDEMEARDGDGATCVWSVPRDEDVDALGAALSRIRELGWPGREERDD